MRAKAKNKMSKSCIKSYANECGMREFSRTLQSKVVTCENNNQS